VSRAPEPTKFTVTACGSAATAVPYEIDVRYDATQITIDGLTLSWNDALAAFDASISADRVRDALFGDRPRRKRSRRKP